MRRDLVWAWVFALSAAGLTGALTFGYYELLPAGRSLPGTFVGGRLQPPHVALGDWLEQRRKELGQREAYLELPEHEGTVKTTFTELGIELDVAATLQAVRDHAESGTLTERMARALTARKLETDLPLTWSFDPERAKHSLHRLAPDVWRDPVDARLDLDAHARIDDVPGRELDVEGTLELIATGERDELAVFPIVTKPVTARVTSAMLANVDVSKVLSSFETGFGNTGRGRAVNISNAARYLDGLVIAPGQTISFNQVVGPRTLDRGFVLAPVIKDDELEPGLGGGTCQVASTVHAAAVFGGLEVVQRRSHSRPSGYAPMGLDATVIFGEVDLKLKNPYDSPLIVHAFVTPGSKLRVEFLGREPPGKVEHTYAVVKTYDYYRRVWTKPFIRPGKVIKHQRGIKGYDVVSTVRITYADGHVEERHYFSGYRPVPEVYWVGPGANIDDLPDLPEGATRVEVDGVVQGGEVPAVAETPGEGFRGG